MITTDIFDQMIALFQHDPKAPDTLNEFFDQIRTSLNILRDGHLAVIDELTKLYYEASEHNIDISRGHILQLALKMSSESPLPIEKL